MRTALRSNEAAQGILRLIAAFGEAGYQAATLLVKFEFDITRAALAIGLARGCKSCGAGRQRDSRRGCDTCVASLRQRVHRVQDRVNMMLGPAAPVTRHVRARVVYGADRLGEGGEGGTLYDRTGAEVDEFTGAEGG